MKEIKGYEGYEITEDGRVWSNKTNRYLKLSKDKDGYYKVTLSKNGNEKQFFVHRLVAEAYIKNPENKKQQTTQMVILIIITILIYSGQRIMNKMKIIIGKKQKQN